MRSRKRNQKNSASSISKTAESSASFYTNEIQSHQNNFGEKIKTQTGLEIHFVKEK